MPFVVAHQGGWDELLLFAGPVVGVLLWVRWAERRARRRSDETRAGTTNLPDDPDR